MKKLVHEGLKGRNELINGMNIMANAVVSTLGPGGRNVAIQRDFGQPIITKDGVTVAKNIELKDPLQNMGSTIVKEAAQRTNDEAGDGTTTATLLSQTIINESIKYVNNGLNPIEIKRGMKIMADRIIEDLKSMSKQVENFEDISSVALVASNNDNEISDIITKAIKMTGKDGVITIEQSKTSETYFSITEGYEFDRGFVSPYFMTNLEKNTCEFDNPVIILTDQKISTLRPIVNVIEPIIKSGRALVIIAEDFVGEALQLMIMNRIQGNIRICGIKAPGFANSRKEILEDLAVMTGATVISEEKGFKLENMTSQHVGECGRIVVKKDHTTITEGKGNQKDIEERCSLILKQIESTESNYEKEKLQARYAKMNGGIGIIYVGAQTEVEMKEKKDRVEDALNATKAAIEMGIVEGGGVAFLKIYSKESANLEVNSLDSYEKNVGAKIVLRAIQEPARRIIRNMTGDASEENKIVTKCILENTGYNFNSKGSLDMFEQKIIDPVKVTLTAFRNAVSIASTFITTDYSVTILPESNPVINQDME